VELKTIENSSHEQNSKNLHDHTIEEKISRFLERKFRRSRSFKTIIGYKLAINNFCKFLRSKNNLDLNQLLKEIKTNQRDPIITIDEYYTFLTNCPNKTGKIGLSNSAIASYPCQLVLEVLYCNRNVPCILFFRSKLFQF